MSGSSEMVVKNQRLGTMLAFLRFFHRFCLLVGSWISQEHRCWLTAMVSVDLSQVISEIPEWLSCEVKKNRQFTLSNLDPIHSRFRAFPKILLSISVIIDIFPHLGHKVASISAVLWHFDHYFYSCWSSNFKNLLQQPIFIAQKGKISNCA